MSDPDESVASTTSTPRARPLTRRLRRGKFCLSGGVPRANSEITSPRAARSCASARLRAGYTRSGPVPTTAMLLPALRESAAMRGGVDAERQAADDGEAGGRQRRGERLGVGAALRGRVAAADDREGRAPRAVRGGRGNRTPEADRRFRAARADSRHRPTRRGRSRLPKPRECRVRARSSSGARIEARGGARGTRGGGVAPAVAASTRLGAAEGAQEVDERARRDAGKLEPRPGLGARIDLHADARGREPRYAAAVARDCGRSRRRRPGRSCSARSRRRRDRRRGTRTAVRCARRAR